MLLPSCGFRPAWAVLLAWVDNAKLVPPGGFFESEYVAYTLPFFAGLNTAPTL